MVSAINSALSGLNAASKKLEVSANNIANQFSTSLSADGKSTTPYTAQKVDQVTLSNGAIQAHVNDTQQPVDQATEMVNTLVASYDFKANLKTLKIADEMQQNLLNIIS